MTGLGQPWPNWSFSSNHSAQIYVWIYENRAKDLSPSLTLYKKLHRPFNSIIHRQSVNTQPTHPPFLCLAGWCLDSQLAGQLLARALLQRKSAFSLTKMPVSVTHPTPLGEELHPPAWCQLIARQLSYHLQPSLTEAPLAFQARERPPCRLSPAGRRKSFASNLTRFS